MWIQIRLLLFDQTAPIGAVCSGSTLFVGKASKTFQQITKADDFCCDWRFKETKSATMIIFLKIFFSF